MEQDLLKRKLNPFLLITTVLVLAILAGSSVIYQQELGELVGTTDNLSTQLQNTKAELEQARENVSDLREIRSNLENDVAELETELADLEESTSEEIEGLESDLEDARTERDDAQEQVSTLEDEVDQWQEDYNAVLLSLELVCGDLNESKTSFSECEAYGFD